MKRVLMFGLLLVLGGCGLNSLSTSSSTDSKQPVMRYLGSGNETRGAGRRHRFGTGSNLSGGKYMSGFNGPHGSGFNMQERMKSFATGDRELFQKMQEYRQSGNLSGADEIRAQLKEKYPDMFNRPQRNSN